MLVLQRSIGERIVIGDGITVEVVAVRSGGRVRLGVTAPREVPVHREEVYQQLKGKEVTDAKGSEAESHRQAS